MNWDGATNGRNGRGGRARSIAVVGGGFGGVGAAVMLRRSGYSDVTVFERGERIGGVWHHNTYPGAACDVPSHLYEFSFAPNHCAWRRSWRRGRSVSVARLGAGARSGGPRVPGSGRPARGLAASAWGRPRPAAPAGAGARGERAGRWRNAGGRGSGRPWAWRGGG